MILFFFLLLMLAIAWGVADHYRDLLAAQPPPAPTVKKEVAIPPAIDPVPPVARAAGEPSADAAPDNQPPPLLETQR